MSNKNKIVIFEKIRPIYYYLIFYYILKKYKVFVFNFDCDIRRYRCLRSFINRGKLIPIYIKPIAEEHGLAIDQTEIIYDKLKKEYKIVNLLKEIYMTDDVDLIFKKSLVKDIFKYIYMNYYLNREGKKSKVYFVPDYYDTYENIVMKFSSFKARPLEGVCICFWTKPLFFISSFLDRFYNYFSLFLYLLFNLVIYVYKKVSLFKASKKEFFKYCISIEQLFQIKYKGRRSFDFILDHEEINKKNTLFLIRMGIDKYWLEEIQGRGYRFFMASGICKLWVSVKDLNGLYIFKAFKALIASLVDRPAVLPFVSAFCIGIRNFIYWDLVSKGVSFEKYLYTNQETVGQVATNVMLRKGNIETWYYAFSIGGAYIYSKDGDFNKVRNVLWSYLGFDYFVGINEDSLFYYKLHYQGAKKYYSVGSLYSEIICEAYKSINKREFIHQHFKKAPDKTKIITFYDTTFIDSEDAPTTYQDGINFYKDILGLLEEEKDILIIIKPAKNELRYISPSSEGSSQKKGRELLSIWDALKKNNRVFWAGDRGDVSSIIAVSDVVITHCLSSPTVEALGARKKAFWYESANKHVGVMYDKIPGLVVHGYGNLKNRLNELLYDTTDEKYSEYLDHYIKGKVESHLDGLALTRFRNLLKEK